VQSDTTLWTAPAIAEVVIPVCNAALAHRRGTYSRVVALLVSRREHMRLRCGSNAQRDFVMQMLIDAAIKSGRHDAGAAMIVHEANTRALPPIPRAGYAAARWLA
jgi:hypothetical protein